MALLQENQNNKKSDKVQLVIGIILLIASLLMLNISMAGDKYYFSNFIDFPSVFFLVTTEERSVSDNLPMSCRIEPATRRGIEILSAGTKCASK